MFFVLCIFYLIRKHKWHLFSFSLVGLHCELQHQNGRQTHWENYRATRIITVAICYDFLLQWAAIILWHIITSNYFKLNKRCDTIRLTDCTTGPMWKRNYHKNEANVWSDDMKLKTHTQREYIMKKILCWIEWNWTNVW